MITMQHTIEEYIDRVAHIDRLTRSMERWRIQELDRILPDEYAYYCNLLDYLQAGGTYTVKRFDPASVITETKIALPPVVTDIVQGFALSAISAAHSAKRHNRKRGIR